MNKQTPLISVLLPVYNCEHFLAETLYSLLAQTYENFEVIAINDGSTDKSLEILNKFARLDSRIYVISRENKGLVATLNEAADLAKGIYLARIDGDDLALPKRFAFQADVLETDKSCVLVTSTFDVINEDSEYLYHDAVPTLESDLRISMYTRNPVAHGSIMMRHEAFDKAGGYSALCGPTEDYELWQRMIKLGSIRILPQTLFRWRVNTRGITSTKSSIVETYMKENLSRYWDDNPFQIVPRKQLKAHFNFYLCEDKLHGASTKHILTRDLVEACIQLLKRKRTGTAIKQLFIVASTGRHGVKCVYHRLLRPIKWHIQHIFEKPSDTTKIST